MNLDQNAEDWRVAVHEAAHFVVGHHLKLHVGDAVIETTGSRLGCCFIYPTWWGELPGPGRRSVWVRRYIVAAMAGAEAEFAILGAADGGDWADRQSIWEAMKHMRIKGGSHVGDDAWLLMEQKLRTECRRLCRRLRNDILAVAHALQRDGRISDFS